MTNPTSDRVILVLCLFLKTYFSVASNTISANQSLSGPMIISSEGGQFQLGFFNPRGDSDYYLGIWLQMDSSRQVIWLANREKPVSFDSQLRISDRNLVLFDESNRTIWSTSVDQFALPVKATLLETGNLVLGEDGSDSSEPLWQSFDHPTHTFLAGSKLGHNKITNTSQVLTSWKSENDPAPGLFSLQIEPRDNSFIIEWNRSKVYWSSGGWNGKYFSSVPGLRFNNIYNYSFVSNDKEAYFTYSVYNNSNIKITLLVMDVSGQIKQLNLLQPSSLSLFWSLPTQQCDVYAFCGADGSCDEIPLPVCRCLTGFKPASQADWDLGDHSKGCIRKAKLQCDNNIHASGDKDRFQETPSLSLPEDQQLMRAGSLQECESRCLNTCSCTSYTFHNDTCSIWTGNLLNLKQLEANDSNGRTLYIRLAASEFPSSMNASGNTLSKKRYAIIFGTLSLALFILCTVFYVYYRRRKSQARNQGNRGFMEVGLRDTEKQIVDFLRSGQFTENEKKGIDVPSVSLKSIGAATDNFSEANKLGRGGFGQVYKGKFPGGQEIAIKRLSSGSGQGLEEFKNEVLLIAKLQHRNLVRLLGYCVEGDEKMLLYEYMPNKSLDSFIFDRTLSVLVNWEMRFNILLGIARGLRYLHHESRLRIIHRDLKTSNVLLDEEMNPKISDFGLARIVGGKQTEANTNRVVGTYGYMSPEYALDGIFSIKSDVFSFGVMVLEIISGKRNTGIYQSEEALSLLAYAWKLWEVNTPLDLMDASLSEICNVREFLRCMSVGLLCVQEDPSDRPTILTVVSMLGSEIESHPRPKKPAFFPRRSQTNTSSSSKPLSVNELTSTLEQGR